MNELIQEKLKQIFDLSLRINLETDCAAFCQMYGHIHGVDVKVADCKKNWKSTICKFEIRHQPFDFGGELEVDRALRYAEFIEEFKEQTDEIISTLSEILCKYKKEKK